jgi:hypothetical protein
MSILSSEYSNYLTYLYDYNKKLEFFQSMFSKSYNYFKNTNYLNKDFAAIQNQFPKFPYFFNVISSLDNINLVAIQNCSMDNTEYLLSILYGSDVIANKSTFDNIPNNIDDILLHVNYQFSYLADPINYYNYNLYTTPYLTENLSNRNEFSNLFTDNQYDSTIDGNIGMLQHSTFILQHATYCLLNNLLSSQFDLYLTLYRQILYKQKNSISIEISKTDFSNSFTEFVKSNQVILSKELTNIITKIIFSFDNINDAVCSNIQTIVINKLLYNTPSSTIVSCFNTFLNKSVAYEPYLVIFSNLVNSLTAHLSAKYTSDIFNNANDIMPDLKTILTNPILFTAVNNATSNEELVDFGNIHESSIVKAIILENNAIGKYFGKMDELNIQNYMFLLFLYKFWPLKFINTLQLIMQEYTQLNIKTNETSDNLFSNDEDYKILLKNFIGESQTLENDVDIDYDKLKTYLTNNYTLDNIQQEIINNNLVKFSCSTYYLQLMDNFIKSDNFNQLLKELLNDIFIYLRDAGHIPYGYDWYSKYETLGIYLKSSFQAKIFDPDNICLFHDITISVQNLCEEIFDTNNENYEESTKALFLSIPSANNIKENFNITLNDVNIINRMHNSVESFTLSTITKELFLGILINYLQ